MPRKSELTDYERYRAAEVYHDRALRALERVILEVFPDFPKSQREWKGFFEALRDAQSAPEGGYNAAEIKQLLSDATN